jgi:hypothetical protein
MPCCGRAAAAAVVAAVAAVDVVELIRDAVPRVALAADRAAAPRSVRCVDVLVLSVDDADGASSAHADAAAATLPIPRAIARAPILPTVITFAVPNMAFCPFSLAFSELISCGSNIWASLPGRSEKSL